VEQIARLPVVLGVTFRSEFQAPWIGQPHVTSLSLRRLSRDESEELVSGIVGNSVALPSELLDEIIERTDGVPLFLEEVTKAVLENAIAGAQISATPSASVAVPAALHASLLARIDRLGSAAKEIAQVGAAIGREFSYELLAATAQRNEAELREAIGRLVEAGLLFQRGTPPQATFLFKHALVQDTAYGTLLRSHRREFHNAIATALEQRLAIRPEQEASVGEHALLAHHWLRSENLGNALRHTLEAAQRAAKIYACAEAINHYWQALDLMEQLPERSGQTSIYADTILSLVRLPGWARDEAGKPRMLCYLDQAISDAVSVEQVASVARLEAIKGELCEDEALLIGAITRATNCGDPLTRAFVGLRYGNYLGQRGRFDEAIGHVALAIDIMGAQGKLVDQGIMMAHQGRCYNARAGTLKEAIAYAMRAREAGDKLGDARLRASRGMEAEAYLYAGDWCPAVLAAEEALPLAWEIGDWGVVLWSSGWAAVAYLRLGRLTEARRLLERAFGELPVRALHTALHLAYPRIASAEVHLAAAQFDNALNDARRALLISEEGRLPLEEGAAHRVLGQVHEAMGNRAQAEAEFCRSLEVLEGIQSRPELAQTLLAYGRFRGDIALIERSLSLFEEMNAGGWIEEARAALGNELAH
jgi:tetratricopeptide (TPR) repeat protein